MKEFCMLLIAIAIALVVVIASMFYRHSETPAVIETTNESIMVASPSATPTATPTPTPPAQPVPDTSDVLGATCTLSNEYIVQAINTERARRKLRPYTINSQLINSAQAKANDLSARGYWSHYDPEGQWFVKFVNEAGYKYKDAGENLAKQFACDEQAVRAWINSPGHRANLFARGFSEIGIGRNGTYIVAHFGRR